MDAEAPPPSDFPAEPPRKPRAELRAFVDDVVSGQVLTSTQVPQDLWRAVFLPLAFGGLNDAPENFFAKVGVLYAHRRDAGRMGVNGFPIFFSLSFLHVDDWAIAREAILAEQERRKNIPLPGDEPVGRDGREGEPP